MTSRVGDEPWYRDGLQFSCTQCGNCCGGESGFVWVSDDEIAALADHLGMSDQAFRRKYTEEVYKRGVTLVEQANYDCVFFKRGVGCTVYQQRPKQCRTWPFWQPLVQDKESWDASSLNCPGMDQGELHSADKITQIAADDGLARRRN